MWGRGQAGDCHSYRDRSVGNSLRLPRRLTGVTTSSSTSASAVFGVLRPGFRLRCTWPAVANSDKRFARLRAKPSLRPIPVSQGGLSFSTFLYPQHPQRSSPFANRLRRRYGLPLHQTHTASPSASTPDHLRPSGSGARSIPLALFTAPPDPYRSGTALDESKGITRGSPLVAALLLCVTGMDVQ